MLFFLRIDFYYTYHLTADMGLMDVKQAILESSRKLDTLNGLVATGGMLDAYAAITYGI